MLKYRIEHRNGPATQSPARAFKDAVYDHFARTTEALASSDRLEIVGVHRSEIGELGAWTLGAD